MIDCHTLYLPNHNKAWLDEIVNELKAEPVTHHVVTGILNDMDQSRRKAYSQGNQKYCSFVDDDDRIKPGIYSKLLNTIENSNASFIWAGEAVMNSDLSKCLNMNIPEGKFKPTFIIGNNQYIHGVILYRRRLLEELLSIIDIKNNFTDWIISSCMYVLGKTRGYDDPIGLNEFGRYWRRHSNNDSLKCRNKTEAGIFISEFFLKMGLEKELVNRTYVKRSSRNGIINTLST